MALPARASLWLQGLPRACFLLLAMLFPPVVPGALAQNTTSAQLDGAGGFSIPSLPAMGGSVTLEAWVRPRSYGNFPSILELGTGTSNEALLLSASGGTSGKPNFTIVSGTTYPVSLDAPDSIPLNVWSHVAAVVNPDRTCQLYVNGVLVASRTATALPASVVRASNFMGILGRNLGPLDGSLADVRIWNTARTAAEIQASMTVGSVSGTTTGLVAAYPFGATGANALADVSGNNRTLTQQDTVQFNVGGPSTPSSSALFDGSGSLRIPSLPAMGGSVTLEGWVRLRSFASWGRLVEVGNTGGNDIIILAPSSGTSGKPHLTIITGGGYIVQVDAANAIPLNVWTHVAGVIDQDRTCRLYVNGQLVGSGTASALPANVARSANFISKGSSDSGLDGSVTDIRIWNTARTAAQIQASMPVGSVSAATAGLVAAYPFGATGAAPLSDVSGNNRTLTPSGPVLFNASGPSSPVTSSSNNAMVATLNGSGWYAMPSLPAFGAAVTVEAWVNPRSHKTWHRPIELGNSSARDIITLVASDSSSGLPLVTFQNGASWATSLSGPSVLPLNTWTHLAGVIGTDRSMRLYVNGQLVASRTDSLTLPSVTRSQNLIGNSQFDNPLDGSIADVRVWSVARTQAEIQASMSVGSITGAATGLVAAYPFGATGSGVLSDVSGNSRTLTQSGSPQYQKMGPGTVGTSGIQGTASLRGVAGTLNLTGQNPFTGGVTVDAGTISLTGDIANNAGNTITVNNGGIFSIDRSDAFGNHTTDAVTPLVINPGGVIRLGAGSWGVMGPITLRGGTLRAVTPSGNGWSFALRGQVTVDGGATTSVLEGPGMGLGATTVSETTFAVADGSAVDDLVVRGGLRDGPAQAWPNAQASGLRKTGSGRMVLLGANTYSGTTTISAGTLQVGDGGTSGTLGSGNVANNGTLAFNRSDTLAVANAISGTGALVQSGAGTVTLSGANTYSGVTTVSAGTLEVGNGGTSGSLGSGNVLNNAALAINRSDSMTVGNAISGTGAVTKSGGGTLTLTGANTYSGGTTVGAGILQLGNGGTTGNLGTGNVANNGTLAFNRSDALAVANVISGTGALVQSGAGTVTLSGANTYSGATTVGAGTLALSGSGSLGTSSAITVAAGARLDASARTTALALVSSQTLANSGGNALLVGAFNVEAGVLAPFVDGSNPAFVVSGGTMIMGPGTSLRVRKTGSALGVGTYKLVAKGQGGSVAGTAPTSVTFTDAGLASGAAAIPALADGELVLRVVVPTPTTFTWGDLSQTYDGTARAVTVTTAPPNVPVRITYDGSTTAPTNAGTYAVVVSPLAGEYSGSATASLVVAKKAATLTLGNLNQSFNGKARPVIVAIDPPGLSWSATYNGSPNAPTNVGVYSVVVASSDPNHVGSAFGQLRVKQADPNARPPATPNPPGQLNHQGYLADEAGNPLGSPNPRNHDLVFRIFAAESGGSPLWSELQSVTVYKGRYAVQLGDGMSVGVEPKPSLEDVLAFGLDGARYLEVTVKGLGTGGADVVMNPRFQLLSQPYSFLSLHAITADALGNAQGTRVLRSVGANVGINVENPSATLDVGGTVMADSLVADQTMNVTGDFNASSFVGGGTIPLGGIVIWSGTTPPTGWALCDGRTVNGRTTPNLTGRFVLGQGQGQGLTGRDIGQVGGQTQRTMGIENMPHHAHLVQPQFALSSLNPGHSHSYDTASAPIGVRTYYLKIYESGYPTGRAVQRFLSHDAHSHEVGGMVPLTDAGGNQSFVAMPPHFVLAYIMRVE